MSFLERYQRETEGFDIHSSDGEAHFSWSQCDTCGSTLGGDRYTCTLAVAGKGEEEQIEVESCVDCVMFAANGQLPEEEDDA